MAKVVLAWPLDGTGLHGYDTLHGKGVRFFWRDGHGEKEGYARWKQIERELSALITAEEYYQLSEQVFTEDIKQAEEREEIQSEERRKKRPYGFCRLKIILTMKASILQ